MSISISEILNITTAGIHVLIFCGRTSVQHNQTGYTVSSMTKSSWCSVGTSHRAGHSLQSSHPSQHNVDLQRPREELGDSSDISPQLSCLAASQAGLVVARTDQQQLVCLVLPDVYRVVSDVYRMGTGVRSVSYEVRSMSYEAWSVSLLSVPLLSGRQPGGADYS